MTTIEKAILSRLLRKALLYRVMANLNDLILKVELTHRDLSNSLGYSDNWFNDAYNNNEDIAISSFVKILSVINQESADNQKLDLKKFQLISLFDNKILSIASLISRLSDEDESYISQFILADKTIFLDLVGDWASMSYRNKLTEIEMDAVNQIRNLISS